MTAVLGSFGPVRIFVAMSFWWRWTGMDTEAAPRGYTPLLDSIGRIAALVEQRNPRSQAATAFPNGRLQEHRL